MDENLTTRRRTRRALRDDGRLVSDPNGLLNIVVSDTRLFVTDSGPTTSQGSIGAYTTSGATVNAMLIAGLNEPNGFVLSGSNLFVITHTGTGVAMIGQYTTAGATVNAALVPNVSPVGSGPTYRALRGDGKCRADHWLKRAHQHRRCARTELGGYCRIGRNGRAMGWAHASPIALIR